MKANLFGYTHLMWDVNEDPAELAQRWAAIEFKVPYSSQAASNIKEILLMSEKMILEARYFKDHSTKHNGWTPAGNWMRDDVIGGWSKSGRNPNYKITIGPGTLGHIFNPATVDKVCTEKAEALAIADEMVRKFAQIKDSIPDRKQADEVYNTLLYTRSLMEVMNHYVSGMFRFHNKQPKKALEHLEKWESAWKTYTEKIAKLPGTATPIVDCGMGETARQTLKKLKETTLSAEDAADKSDRSIAEGALKVRNHFKFPLHDYLYVLRSDKGTQVLENREYVQLVLDAIKGEQAAADQLARAATFPIQLRNNAEARLPGKGTKGISATVRSHFKSGLPSAIRAGGREVELFDLSFVEIERSSTKASGDHSDYSEILKVGEEQKGKTQFKQVELNTGKAEALVYSGTFHGTNTYRVHVIYTVTDNSCVDVSLALETTEKKISKGYLGLVKHVTCTDSELAYIRWKGDIQPISRTGRSPRRTVRMHQWTGDVTWLGLVDPGKGIRSLMSAYHPALSRPVPDGKVGKIVLNPDHTKPNESWVYRPVNDFVLNDRVFAKRDGYYMISEIANDLNTENYIGASNVLPDLGETVLLHFRLLEQDNENDTAVIDRAFTAWNGYRKVIKGVSGPHIEYGVENVRFGTSYFPHSTLIENFKYWRVKDAYGQSWWPISASVWEYGKEEIKRDLRIAKALGLDMIRIHWNPNTLNSSLSGGNGHINFFESPNTLNYLDFIFKEIKGNQMDVLFDSFLSAKERDLLLERYSDYIDYYEIENEVLNGGVYNSKLERWKEAIRMTRKKDPSAQVLMTAAQQMLSNYREFVKRAPDVTALGHHAYVDHGHQPTFAKETALSFGNFASRRGYNPINTEFGWRMIARRSEEYQANHFREVFGHFLSQQAVPELFQFQFNENFCVPPETRGALRHYDLLRKDGTAKPQTMEFKKLIRAYAGPEHVVNQVSIEIPDFELKSGQQAVNVTVKNTCKETVTIASELILPGGLKGKNKKLSFTLAPGETKQITRSFQVPEDASPGFYHFFEKVTFNEKLHYGWGVGNLVKEPKLDIEQPLIPKVFYKGGVESLKDVELAKVDRIIFGEKASSLEVDWAYYIFFSLRSATGTLIKRYSDQDVLKEKDYKHTFLLVGNEKTNKLIPMLLRKEDYTIPEGLKDRGIISVCRSKIAQEQRIILITGNTKQLIERAASDFLYRYWRYAKDAITFRRGVEWYLGSSRKGPEGSKKTGEDVSVAVNVSLPDKALVNETIRIQVLSTTEPPGPIGNIVLRAKSDSGISLNLGTSDDSGEIIARFPKPGTYRIFSSKENVSVIKEAVIHVGK
ncbi:MAG: hypothetical protein GY792_15170 [Gammaproteobacteria bacterium]|nr:hypothetical protein [Gammaproteobacteria bacterium]